MSASLCIVPNCYTENGVILEEFVLRENVSKIRNFVVNDDDTFIFSYPRTGTTWTEKILAGLLEGSEVADNLDIEARFPFIEFTQPPSDGCPPYDGLDLATNQKRPRFIKSHLPPILAPAHLGKAKIILIIRDSQDCFASHYHFYKSMTWVKYSGTSDELFKQWMDGNHVYSGYWNWYKSWGEAIARGDFPRVHFINYETLKADTTGEIKRLAQFIGTDVTDAQVEQVQKISDFSRMKKTVDIPGIPDFIRSGKVGEGTQLLKENQKSQIQVAVQKLRQEAPVLPLDLYTS